MITRTEQAWARCVLDTLFPGWAPADSERFVRDTVGAMPLAGRAGFRLALAAVTVAPVVLERRLALLPALDAATRLEVVEAFARSDVYLARSAFNLLKATAAMICARTTARRP